MKGKQFSDNNLWSYARPQGSANSDYGHIAINLLNDIQDNRANEDFTTVNPPRYKKFSTFFFYLFYYLQIKLKKFIKVNIPFFPVNSILVEHIVVMC